MGFTNVAWGFINVAGIYKCHVGFIKFIISVGNKCSVGFINFGGDL